MTKMTSSVLVVQPSGKSPKSMVKSVRKLLEKSAK